MSPYHINTITANPTVCKTLNNCPLSHYDSKSEAKKTFDNETRDRLLRNPVYSPLTRTLVKNNKLNDPVDELIILGEYLTERGYDIAGIVPAGSTLYNTKIPGQPTHDYDYFVFVNDELYNYKHIVLDTLDMFIIPVNLVTKYVSQPQIIEGYFAVISKNSYYVTHDFKNFFSKDSLKTLYGLYEEHLRDYVRKHEMREYPPARLDRERKHMLRWVIYLERDDKEIFDPRLSLSEREQWLTQVL